MRSLDDYDYEVHEMEKEGELKVKLLLSFKSMTLVINRLVEETREITDKYPKSELLKIWCSDMLIFFILFFASYNALFIATVPFMFFYGYVLISIGKAWKGFGYKKSQYVLMTIGALIVLLAISVGLRMLLFK